KILRTLQERVVQPVGSSRRVEVDVRVITATHQDLQQAIRDGHFRQDLYYRIKGVELTVPPLRQRREDIALLAEHFLARHTAQTGRDLQMAPDAMDKLLAHHWPGNVRELEHAIAAAAAMSEGSAIRATDLHLSAPESTTSAPANSFAALQG